jgi:isocitrate dehydrogenase
VILHDYSIARNAVVLKGPFFTPVGQGYASRNLELRRTFDLYVLLKNKMSDERREKGREKSCTKKK